MNPKTSGPPDQIVSRLIRLPAAESATQPTDAASRQDCEPCSAEGLETYSPGSTEGGMNRFQQK